MLNLLQSMLAFALTMLGLATIVTVVMEMITRFTRRRGRVMRHVLEILFEKEIAPLLGSLPGDRVKAAIDAVMASPIKPDQGTHWFFTPAALLMKRMLGADESTDLTTRDFLVRLSRTEVGTELYEAAKGEWEATLERIELRYEELCKASSDWFKKTSASGSLLIGILLAFALNVDGMRILHFYTANPDRAAAMVASAEQTLKLSEEAQKRLQEAGQEVPADNAGSKAELMADLEHAREVQRAIRAYGGELAAAGLPVGASFFPYCSEPAAAATRDKCRLTGMDYFFEVVLWAIVVLVSGVLIGLGAPFWYNAASGLLRATQLLRGKAAADQPISEPARAAAPGTETLRKLFERRASENDDVDLKAAQPKP